jgi:AcrR family transcriptional regulator
MTATIRATPADTPRRGRPRRIEADEAILTATVELLGDVGVAGFSMDLLAQRAGVGKATIYRRWPSKEALMLEAMRTVVTPVAAPDTGAVRADLRAYVGELVARYGSARASSDVLPHLLEASCYDDQLRVSLEDYLRNRQIAVRTIIGRGIERGELPAKADIDLLVDLVLGPFFYRRLLTGAPLDDDFADRLVEHVLS